MFHQLHNVEAHPEVLLRAEDLLVSLLSETSNSTGSKDGTGLLSLTHYSRKELAKFLRQQAEVTDQRWLAYLQRRKAGHPRELFGDREGAKKWLRRCAPVKLVDGAWLGYVHGVSTPFAHRRASKAAWQVMSEEYGDGNLEQHHVHMYRELLQAVGAAVPDAHEAAFLHAQWGFDDIGAWEQGVAQLLISVLPHKFFAEILGFNLHYELVSLGTMMAARELREVGIDPYYFTVHITVDNADSGHTAIAAEAVDMYLTQIRALEGDAAADAAWKRVQAGYLLSEHLASSHGSESPRRLPAPAALDHLEEKVVGIFEAKARVSQHVHSCSRLQLGGQALTDWLSPASFETSLARKRFLDDLADARPWVCRGNSRRSKLIKEMVWGGKMFGAFTHSEVSVVEEWIDSLNNPDASPSLTSTSRAACETTIHGPLQLTLPLPVELFPPPRSAVPQAPISRELTVNLGARQVVDSEKLVALWLTHPCLLQRFVSIPSRSADSFGCAAMRVLRAQNGFQEAMPGVAGMDEVRRRGASPGLVELALEASRQLGLDGEPRDLQGVLEATRAPSRRFAMDMLTASLQPVRNRALLVGMALAFVQMREQLARRGLPSTRAAKAMTVMVEREKKDLLGVCVVALSADNGHYTELSHGFELARAEIDVEFAFISNVPFKKIHRGSWT
ncbi:hypothetical protein SLS56_011487 [Neofusicoccum ribis]|uniref:Uncharacterized protein n=1 Tax=Neofusicoccum ribis TaxID=45134 RepID=A0ABR3SC39_9PEZI